MRITFSPLKNYLFCLILSFNISARVIFIDDTIETTTSFTYDPEKRSAIGGKAICFKDFQSALKTISPGDSLFFRVTQLTSTLKLSISGRADQPILFSSYKNENVLIKGKYICPALDLSNARYLIIEHLTIDSVQRWVFATNTHHCILRQNVFTNALDEGGSSKTGIFFELSTYNRIENNIINNSTQDNLALHKSDFNIIQDNTISKAAHTTWTIKCGNYNIIRGNRFSNPIQKIGEIFDCHEAGSEHQLFIYDSTRHNVVDQNIFSGAVKYYSTSGGNGIQYAGQMGIIRRNLFYDCNSGVGLQYYKSEAEHASMNRIYHNVFYKNECGGISINGGAICDIHDNLFFNNILFNNKSCEAKGNAQIIYRDGPVKSSRFFFNAIFSSNGNRTIGALFGSDNTVSYYEEGNQGPFF